MSQTTTAQQDHPTSANRLRNSALTIIFKGTSACNAGCRFCSAAGGSGRSITAEDFEILARRIDEFVSECGLERLSFTFHGGEPTLLGARFLEQACARLRQLPVPVEFSMQSNLIAFPTEIVAVVHRYGIQTGSSVDPIESGRCTVGGGDSFPVWVRNREMLAAAGVPVGAIFLITRPAVGQGRRIYEIFKSFTALSLTPPGFQFNLVYPQGRASVNSDLLVSGEEGGRFLVDAYEAWEASGRAVSISPFEELSDWFESGRSKPPELSCGSLGRCHETHVGIDADLNVAGCGRRLDTGAFYGNLRTQSLSSLLLGSEERKKLANRSSLLSAGDCAGCEFFPICNGGCPDDAALSTGDIMARTAHCVAYRMLFDAMAARVGVQPANSEKRLPAVDLVVHVGTIAGEKPTYLRDREQFETWLLPTKDGRSLSFSSRLQNALQTGAQRVKIWVPGSQVKTLHLWARLLSDPRVEVVLFDCTDALLDNLAVLGRLGARVRLDLACLFESGWSEDAALQLAERYLSEETWNVRLEPFESMLFAAVRGECISLTNHWGLQPGRNRVCIGSLSGASEIANQVVHALRKLESATAASWYLDHRACTDCADLNICGTQLAKTGGGCNEKLHEIVSNLQTAAAEMRSNLGEDGLAVLKAQ